MDWQDQIYGTNSFTSLFKEIKREKKKQYKDSSENSLDHTFLFSSIHSNLFLLHTHMYRSAYKGDEKEEKQVQKDSCQARQMAKRTSL